MSSQSSEEDDRRICAEIARISIECRNRGTLSSGKQPEVETRIELIQLIEQLAWEAHGRGTYTFLEDRLDQNADILWIDPQENLVTIGGPIKDGGVDLGFARGLTEVWPISPEAYHSFITVPDFVWSSFERIHLLPAEKSRPAQSILIGSVVNLSTVICQREWFRSSGMSSSEGNLNAHKTISRLADHIVHFLGEFRITQDKLFLEPYGRNSNGCLPRFIAEVEPNSDAIGTTLAAMFGFEEQEVTTTTTSNWEKRKLDLSIFGHRPMSPGIWKFSQALSNRIFLREALEP